MRFLAFIFALLSTSTFAMTLSKGHYKVLSANNDSVCPQYIIPIIQGEEMTALKVYYMGDCNEQGPYYFYCSNNLCDNLNIEYQIESTESFSWKNLDYNIEAKLKLKK